MGTFVTASVAVALLLGIVIFVRHSRTPAWWESETRKALLEVMVAMAPFLGMRYEKPHVQPPVISAPADPAGRREKSVGLGGELVPDDLRLGEVVGDDD
jgi:hypothetical protein